jgi:hypothetical protein
MKSFITPVIIEVTEIATKRLKNYLETKSEKHAVDSPQKKKTAVLGT